VIVHLNFNPEVQWGIIQVK